MREFFILPIMFFLFFNYVYSSEVKVERFVCSKKVINREPVEISKVFSTETEKIYCFSKLKTDKFPTYIYHVWYKDNKKIAEVKLNIKYSSYRTWSYKSISDMDIGKWKIVLLDSNKNKLSETSFEIVSNFSNKTEETVNKSLQNIESNKNELEGSDNNDKKIIEDLKKSSDTSISENSVNKTNGDSIPNAVLNINPQERKTKPITELTNKNSTEAISNWFYVILLFIFYILFFPTVYFFNKKVHFKL